MEKLVSKIQVKNLVAKHFGKNTISKVLQGRIVSHNTRGYLFDAAKDGAIIVNYYAPFYSGDKAAAAASQTAEAMAKVTELLTGLGFELDIREEFAGWNENHTERRFRTITTFKKVA